MTSRSGLLPSAGGSARRPRRAPDLGPARTVRSNAGLPPVAITLGDVCGIGPEVIAKVLLRAPRLRSPCFVIGDPEALARELRGLGAAPERLLRVARRADEIDPRAGAIRVLALADGGLAAARRGRISARAGRSAVAWLDAGARLAVAGRIRALVTGPVNKAAVALTVPGFSGHTERLALIARAPFPVMMLAGRELKVATVTRHIPLARVPRVLTAEAVLRTVMETHRGLRRWFRIRDPRIAVCGLNPHAGEGGLLGSEDASVVRPAVRGARRRGVRATGPLPADTVFAAAREGRYDGVVAMYHDQAMIPVKTVEMDRSVNATLGLPFLRTSPAHGTAFDIAGRGIARPGSMRAAIEMAVRGVVPRRHFR